MSPRPAPFRPILLVSLLLLGPACSLTTTSTEVLTASGPTTTRVRLSTPESAPLTSSWRLEGHTVIGSIAFTSECSQETTGTITRRERTVTQSNRRGSVGWVMSGLAVTMLGAGLIAASSGQSQEVICGDGHAPQEGDECRSAAGSYVTAGAAVIGAGLGLAVVGLVGLRAKPKVETQELSSDPVSSVTPNTSCGVTPELEGMRIAIDLPNAGRWSGRVDRDGAARIELGPELRLRPMMVEVLVERVPAALAGRVADESVLGELEIRATPAQRSIGLK